jgi:arylformamidase
LIDISRTISPGALVFPGDPGVQFVPVARISEGSPYDLTRLTFPAHILTHMDAPRHFFPSGPALDEIPLQRFAGPAEVIDISGDCVLADHVPWDARGVSLLFRSRNSGAWSAQYDEKHVFISPEAAQAIVARGANLAGVDYLSVDPFDSRDFPAHRILLAAGVLILEGLDLQAVAPGRYSLLAFPLKIAQADGAPVRAVLLESDDRTTGQRPLAPALS